MTNTSSTKMKKKGKTDLDYKLGPVRLPRGQLCRPGDSPPYTHLSTGFLRMRMILALGYRWWMWLATVTRGSVHLSLPGISGQWRLSKKYEGEPSPANHHHNHCQSVVYNAMEMATREHSPSTLVSRDSEQPIIQREQLFCPSLTHTVTKKFHSVLSVDYIHRNKYLCYASMSWMDELELKIMICFIDN